MHSQGTKRYMKCCMYALAGLFATVQLQYTISSMNSMGTFGFIPAFSKKPVELTSTAETSAAIRTTASEITTICEKYTSCGYVFLSGDRCSNFSEVEFTGKFICYDSNGCEKGHQINAIALLSSHFGEQFRVLDPFVYTTVSSENGEYQYELSYDSFIVQDVNITVPRELMHSQCARLVTDEEENDVKMDLYSAITMPGYLSSVLIPFLDKFTVPSTTCPNLPLLQDAVVVYTPQESEASGEEDRNETIQTYCDAIRNTFDGSNSVLAFTDEQTIPCDELNVTSLKSLEMQYEYQSSVHKFLCNIRYLAQYQRHFSHSNVFIQRLIFAEMLRAGNKRPVYDITSKSWIEPLTTKNTTCRRCCPGCGCMTLPGFSWACDPFRKFTGKHVCYDSSHTGCGLGHQLNAIATLWKFYGDNLRIIDPIQSGGHSEYVDFSYSSFMKDDLLIPREESMFEECAYIDNGYDMGTRTGREMMAPGYLSNILVPFIATQFLACRALPVIPNAVAVKIRSTDRFSNEDEIKAQVRKYCEALQEHFSNYRNALVMTDGPELECEGFNITHLESMETPNMYMSPAQKLLCGLRYIAQYPAQVSLTSSNLQQFIYAEMMLIGNNISVFDVGHGTWENRPTY